MQSKITANLFDVFASWKSNCMCVRSSYDLQHSGVKIHCNDGFDTTFWLKKYPVQILLQDIISILKTYYIQGRESGNTIFKIHNRLLYASLMSCKPVSSWWSTDCFQIVWGGHQLHLLFLAARCQVKKQRNKKQLIDFVCHSHWH